ncbi:MAG TPA: hypothetical protein VFS20_18210 [Longimicrobium sp.]|nr:hypothetical protein [Longimicrobium sp.]
MGELELVGAETDFLYGRVGFIEANREQGAINVFHDGGRTNRHNVSAALVRIHEFDTFAFSEGWDLVPIHPTIRVWERARHFR